MGLYNMEQRARQIGGKLEIISAPGSGTRILIDAPIEGFSAGASLKLIQTGGMHG
jgi:signal transduction histidine kinase